MPRHQALCPALAEVLVAEMLPTACQGSEPSLEWDNCAGKGGRLAACSLVGPFSICSPWLPQPSPQPSHCAVSLRPPIPSVHIIAFTPSHPTPPSTSCSSLSSSGAPSQPGPFLPAQLGTGLPGRHLPPQPGQHSGGKRMLAKAGARIIRMERLRKPSLLSLVRFTALESPR